MELLNQINLQHLDARTWAIHGISLFFSAAFFIFAHKILSLGREDHPPTVQIAVFRFIILIYFSFELFDVLILHAVPEYNRPLYKGAQTIASLFLGIIFNNYFSSWAKKRFGAEKVIDGKVEILASYYSRLTGLLFSIVVSITVIYSIIKIWDMNSLLETTGFLGVIAAFLVFTNPIWLPDLYFGLVILNSDMFGDGDVIRFENEDNIYIINRVSLIYTSLLNIENNNRTLMRNSKIFEHKIDNLTRRASVEGLRQSLKFKVSYPSFHKTGNPSNKKADLNLEVERFYKKIESMFHDAYQEIQNQCEGCLAKNTRFEWGILNAGDFALELVLHCYLAPLPSTKITKKIRKILLGTRIQIIQSVYKQSIIYGVDLSTPTLINIDNSTQWANLANQQPAIL